MKGKKRYNIIILILSIILIVTSGSLLLKLLIQRKNAAIYKEQWERLSKEDRVVIEEIVSLAKSKVGLPYVWGGKSEIMTEERLDELIGYYGDDYYPLDRDEYMGKQAFDCSGLTYYLYNQVLEEFIGYSTYEQEEVLFGYEVEEEEMLPGDLIYIPGHVAIYIGDGKIVHAHNKLRYPIGGVKEQRFKKWNNRVIYRPLDYIKDQKRNL